MNNLTEPAVTLDQLPADAPPDFHLLAKPSGDCRMMNFGGFATPERWVVFDVNDFAVEYADRRPEFSAPRCRFILPGAFSCRTGISGE